MVALVSEEQRIYTGGQKGIFPAQWSVWQYVQLESQNSLWKNQICLLIFIPTSLLYHLVGKIENIHFIVPETSFHQELELG